MKNGRDSRRRNKNIGTAKQGHGKDNRLVIPDRWSDASVFFERLVSPHVHKQEIHNRSVMFIVEPTIRGFTHCCTVADVVRLLSLLDEEHIAGIDFVVLRQPKRKENILSPCWGRLTYWTDICGISGRGVFLEAQNVNEITKWSASINPEEKEMNLLKEEGHVFERQNGIYHIYRTAESIRITQLFRTIPHEVGHYVEYLTKVLEPARSEEDQDRLWTLYNARPQSERETFANRYAIDFINKRRQTGDVPFPRIFDEKQILAEGLQPGWFSAESSSDL